MTRANRAWHVLILVAIAVEAIDWIGVDYFALLALFELLLGTLIGMVIFLPNRK